MASPAAPLIEMFLLAAAGIAEGHAAISETELRGEAARPVVAYGHQTVTSGLAQLEALAKRYAASPECAAQTPVRPILTDAKFRAAALECLSTIEAAGGTLGVAGQRLAKALRAWIEGNDPAQARIVSMQCDAACRMSKMRSGRAA